MKMKKWTVLVVAALLAVLSACGNGNSSSKEDDNVLHVCDRTKLPICL